MDGLTECAADIDVNVILTSLAADHRNRNTKKGEAGYWQVRLTGCVLGNAVTCQLEKVRGR